VLTGLWWLGDGTVVHEVVNLLSSQNYRVRCAAASTLPIFVDRRNRRRIGAAVTNALRVEPTLAARGAMTRALARIRSHGRQSKRGSRS
jgi:HEAT repeat protein